MGIAIILNSNRICEQHCCHPLSSYSFVQYAAKISTFFVIDGAYMTNKMFNGKNYILESLASLETWVQMAKESPTSCVTLDKSSNFSCEIRGLE